MALAELAPRLRRRLRWQGAAIMLLSLAAGGGVSLVAWRVLHLGSMALRWSVAAALMYAVLLACLRRWLLWARADAAAHPQDWRRARRDEREAYGAEAARRARERSANRVDWGANLLDFDELSVLLLVPALVLLVLGALGMFGALPMFAGEGLAGLMAELLLQFVLGSVLLRHTRMPARVDRLGAALLGRTWPVGLAMVLGSALLGAGLQWARPGVHTLAELLQR